MDEHATILPPPPSRGLAIKAMLAASCARLRADAARRWHAAAAALRSLAQEEAGDDVSEADELGEEGVVTRRLSSLVSQRPVRFIDRDEARQAEERDTVVERRK